jgi:hypothetical protein
VTTVNYNRAEKVDLAYDFLVDKEKLGEAFTNDQLAESTGWKEDTCRTYPSKRWHQYVERDGNQYSTSGISFLSKEEFRAVHSQKLQQTTDLSSKGILIHKAREFALLAVSVYKHLYVALTRCRKKLVVIANNSSLKPYE